ncbi:hypothetical protein IQ235_14265 [Oscillatoriales cyanobacterium LEGE 11467]|uniref:Peptidase C-terminal archaeal/bacterial domain-containing protein n=1 Tax=Zarconia navalis LEGE 11467 TaxID=1828826 RepID=A0A928VX78_9CYAN|nr:hypothetical protein [Zarconia navalis]MBE9041944.1 hypothetical protein [Zarconia navalis LEGE 11467]
MNSNLLNLDYYRRVNPDLANFTDEQATQHFFNFGLREGRDFSPVVDLDLYRAANPDLAAVGFTENRQFFDHLSNFGVGEGRLFSNTFHADFYRASHSDLIAIGFDNEQLFDHFLQFGINEGRVASNTFDIDFYLNSNPDLVAAGLDNRQGLNHFSRFGINEGRITSPQFDVGTYLGIHPDLVAAGLTSAQAFDHYQIFGFNERRFAAPVLPVPGDPGDTIETSFDLGTIVFGNRRFSDSLVTGDLRDIYQFTLARPSAVNLDFTVQGVSIFENTQVSLLGRSGDGPEFDEILDTDGRLSANISGVLPAGTYGLSVRTNQRPGFEMFREYEGSILATPVAGLPADRAGNSASAARDLGVLTTVQTFNDDLGLFDTADVYRFTLDATTNIEAVIDGNSHNAIVEIAEDLNNNGEIDGPQVGPEIFATANSESGLGFSLDAGTYFLRLRRDRVDTNYNLTLSPQASRLPPDGAGNTLSSALDLGVLSAGRSFSDTVSTADGIDYYQFEIDTPTNVGIVLDSVGGSPVLAIGRNLNGGDDRVLESIEILQQHFRDIGNIPQQQAWSLSLTPGTYFALVGSVAPISVPYNLNIAPTPPPGLPPDGAGSSSDTARNLDVLTGMETFSDSIGVADRTDYYRFVLDRPSTVDLLLEVAENRFSNTTRFDFFTDANANNIAPEMGESSRSIALDFATLRAETSLALDPGVYFVRVFNEIGDANINYELNLSATF